MAKKLTPEEIISGNRLIAEFMGYIFVDEYTFKTSPNGNTYDRGILGYCSSWDKLMPVVYKCCADLKALGFDKRGSYSFERGYASAIYTMKLDNPIEKVFLEVVNHINKYKK